MSTATAQRLTAILHREEEVYVAECPEVGTVSQGDTVEEALVNLREATELFLEECPQPVLAPGPIKGLSHAAFQAVPG